MSLEEIKSTEYLYLNPPQLKAWLVNANKEFHILGRGLGKTSGILARKSTNNIFQMPRASGMNIGVSFAQQLTRTLPAMIGGWARMGYKRDVHYVIGKRPPVAWRWPEALEPPAKYDYYIHWYNGSGMHLGSQDVAGSTIGMNFQWLQGDEAKKLDVTQLNEETRPAMRGYREFFQHLPEYRSECFTTSMPIKADEKWILEEEKKMDKQLVQEILQLAVYQQNIFHEMQGATGARLQQLRTKYNNAEKALAMMRRQCVFYQEASSLENFAILGEDYFDDLRRSLPDIIFNTEILNLRNSAIEGCFYATFDVVRHTYRGKYHLGYLESLNYDLERIANVDCRQDADLFLDEPLHIAIDWGGHMNYLLVQQKIGIRRNFINEVWVKHPEHIDHLAEKFARYYFYHRNKDLFYRYDVTGDHKKDNSPLTSAEQFVKKLKEIDSRWNVRWQPKEVAPSHEHKFKVAYRAFQSDGSGDMPLIQINEDKCPNLIISILNAPLKDRMGRLEKDKSSEKKHEKIDPLHATHPTDALDIHLNQDFRKFVDPEDYYLGD
jgi:hypothetical protein